MIKMSYSYFEKVLFTLNPFQILRRNIVTARISAKPLTGCYKDRSI